MKTKEIISNLETLSLESLDKITEQIEEIKKRRQEELCKNYVNKLNDLLNPLMKLLDELERKDILGDECRHLLDNEFCMLEYDDTKYIDLKY